MNQSTAILRYLGKKYGYYPANVKEAWDCDATIDFLADQSRVVPGLVF